MACALDMCMIEKTDVQLTVFVADYFKVEVEQLLIKSIIFYITLLLVGKIGDNNIHSYEHR